MIEWTWYEIYNMYLLWQRFQNQQDNFWLPNHDGCSCVFLNKPCLWKLECTYLANIPYCPTGYFLNVLGIVASFHAKKIYQYSNIRIFRAESCTYNYEKMLKKLNNNISVNIEQNQWMPKISKWSKFLAFT